MVLIGAGHYPPAVGGWPSAAVSVSVQPFIHTIEIPAKKIISSTAEPRRFANEYGFGMSSLLFGQGGFRVWRCGAGNLRFGYESVICQGIQQQAWWSSGMIRASGVKSDTS